MNFFKNNPFIRILGFWVSGILIAKFLPSSIYYLVGITLATGIYSVWLLKKRNFLFDLTNSFFIGSLLVLLPFIFVQKKCSEPTPEIFSGFFKAVVLEAPHEKNKCYQLHVKILLADSSKINRTKAILYTEKSKKTAALKAGDQVLCKSKLFRIKNNGNPYEFDYAAFLARRGFYYSAYLKNNAYQLIGKLKITPFLLAENFRSKLLERLRSYIKKDEVFQVISALTLGYRKELSPEIKSHFASTGAMHVLAVSGLHVGMIFLFISQLLYFLKRNKRGRFVYIFIIAVSLWGYALLTGFSPSVQRATVMFSFILIGNNLKRPTAIYNSLAASAFLLLLFNYNMLFEVGFQLSYMAVGSIVFFYPRLEKMLSPKSWVIQKIWQLTCVSLAAQIGTFALSIFYFNQFPIYFWLSNFVVIPAAYLILGLTVAFLLFSSIGTIAIFLSTLLESITRSIIFLLIQIEKLPCSLIEGISNTSTQLLSLLALSFSFMFFIKWRRKSFLFASLILIIFFQLDGLNIKRQLLNQQKIIIYHTDKWLLHLINGRENYLLYEEEKNLNEYLFRNTLQKLQLNKPIFISIDQMDKFRSSDLLLDKKLIQFIDQSICIQTEKSPVLHPDLKLIEKNYRWTDEPDSSILVFLKTKLHSNPTNHAIDRNGAFVIDF